MARMVVLDRDGDQIPKVDMIIKQGATYYRYFALVTNLSTLTLINTASWDARMTIRKGDAGGSIQLAATKSNGMIQLGIQGSAPNQYNVLLNFSASTTDALTDWGQGVFDLELVNGSVVYAICEGTAVLNRAATK